MRDMAGWEWLLGGALLVWVLWRWNRGSERTLSPDQAAEKGAGSANDWSGLLLPIIAVVLFVILLIYSVRN